MIKTIDEMKIELIDMEKRRKLNIERTYYPVNKNSFKYKPGTAITIENKWNMFHISVDNKKVHTDLELDDTLEILNVLVFDESLELYLRIPDGISPFSDGATSVCHDCIFEYVDKAFRCEYCLNASNYTEKKCGNCFNYDNKLAKKQLYICGSCRHLCNWKLNLILKKKKVVK